VIGKNRTKNTNPADFFVPLSKIVTFFTSLPAGGAARVRYLALGGVGGSNVKTASTALRPEIQLKSHRVMPLDRLTLPGSRQQCCFWRRKPERKRSRRQTAE